MSDAIILPQLCRMLTMFKKGASSSSSSSVTSGAHLTAAWPGPVPARHHSRHTAAAGAAQQRSHNVRAPLHQATTTPAPSSNSNGISTSCNRCLPHDSHHTGLCIEDTREGLQVARERLHAFAVGLVCHKHTHTHTSIVDKTAPNPASPVLSTSERSWPSRLLARVLRV